MKVAIITDTHFGVRGDNANFHSNMRKFFEDVFFPKLEASGIDTILHLGDLFDNRKKVDAYTITESIDYFFSKLDKYKFQVILGNHDIYYKETSVVNTPKLMFGHASIHNKVMIHTGPTEINVGGLDILLIPWINKSNFSDVLNSLKTSKARACFGHFEFKGFKFNKNTIAQHGMGTSLFDRFDLVLSGHYHSKSAKGSIHYLGTPTQHTWVDCNEDKGFHILDTETLELEFIKNPHTIFETIQYKEGIKIDESKYKDKYVKIFTQNISSRTELESLVERLDNICHEVIIQENRTLNVSDVELDESVEVEDTLSIIQNYILELNDIKHEEVYSIIEKLYNEAI